MKIVQVSPSQGRLCGVAVFASSMAAALDAAGVQVWTVPTLDEWPAADLCLLQYHCELTSPDDLGGLLARAQGPVAAVAHSPGLDHAVDRLAGVLTMADGLVPGRAAVATMTFPHPALVPAVLSDRPAIRVELGMPVHLPILATSGFLRFDRRFPEVLAALLPGAAEIGWAVQLITSPWYTPSPGLLADLASLRDLHGARFWHVHEHLSEVDLNRRLQAADLLWCWSPEPPMPYASGVVSQLYGSGTRVIAADRPQHQHVLGLPNAVRAPADLPGFVEELLRQMRHYQGTRHDPSPISWEQQIRTVVRFLRALADRRRSG